MAGVLSKRRIIKFRQKIYAHYHAHARFFPWRPPSLRIRKDKTLDPYKVLVSEVMLQQTQAHRVVPYYREFLRRFPTVQSLSRVPLRDVLNVWSGLGYNRRALLLTRAAKELVRQRKGIFPRDPAELELLPGVGPATASAIAAFAWNYPSSYLDTNVRSVFLHEFFPNRKKVADTEIVPLLHATLDRKNPRKWYYALLDYGVFIKSRYGNPNRRSMHYSRQTPFRGSRRELRGKILRALIERPRTLIELRRIIPMDHGHLHTLLHALQREGLIQKKQKFFI